MIFPSDPSKIHKAASIHKMTHFVLPDKKSDDMEEHHIKGGAISIQQQPKMC
jgi:hypothetical protein